MSNGPMLRAAPLCEAIDSLGSKRGRLSEYRRQAYHRWKRRGTVSTLAADRVCVIVLGVHPIEVYGDEWLVGVDT